jgi:hypothetical protein
MKNEKFCGASGGIGIAGSPAVGGAGAICWANTMPAVKIRENRKLKAFLRVMTGESSGKILWLTR